MTSIEWTDETWNPLRALRKDGTGKVGWACVRVSQGCANCYAATQNKTAFWGGTGLDYTVPDLAKVETFLDEKALEKPLHWRAPRKVFVCSMTDLFGEWNDYRTIRRVFDIMRSCDGGITAATGKRRPSHIFQVLTKRPERMRDLALSRALGFDPSDPPSNVWLGTSVEDQKAADERIPHLLATPAAVRFLSCEPLLGPVDLDKPQCDLCGERDDLGVANDGATPWCPECEHEASFGHWIGSTDQIDWCIVGGESGPRARPMDLAWARSLVAQCRAAGVAPFVKQMGSTLIGEAGEVMPPGSRMDARYAYGFSAVRWLLRESHGRDMAEWPEDLKIREFPR